ncbi:GNAT family N-acetyltransferase [Brevundimonas sp. FT23028]|uniref:GNAT family N-acetyltransferase n=1 Tax=Brevundimonas sp. FT23028 TaxID=3393748 RepID=UPI003B587118
MPFDIHVDDLSGRPTQDLLAFHVAQMQVWSPPESVHALDLSALKTPDITVWTVWDGKAVAGVGALRELSPEQGELKSMRTHPDHLRKGVAAALLEHIMDEAKARGLKRLSLETGSGPAFEPALALYRRRGFAEGPAFGGYTATDFNRFLHLDL